MAENGCQPRASAFGFRFFSVRDSQPVQWPLLVQMAAVACADAIEKWVEQTVRIKPPNDLMLGGGKLAGFLLETSNTWDFQVLGIGLNVRSAPIIDGYPTVCSRAVYARSGLQGRIGGRPAEPLRRVVSQKAVDRNVLCVRAPPLSAPREFLEKGAWCLRLRLNLSRFAPPGWKGTCYHGLAL